MEPHQLHSNPSHSLDFSFYDHHRHEDISHDQRARESDLLSTIISFPSTSPAQPVLLHRNSLQDRRLSPSSSTSFFLQSTISTNTSSLEVGTSRNELLQLSGPPDLCESDLVGREKLRNLRIPPSVISSRFQEDSILARLNPSAQLGGADGVTWQTYSDVNDVAGGAASVPNDALQLPVNMNLGAHNMLSDILTVNNDQRSYGHRRDTMWADDHGTELLLLPGISAASDEHQHQHQQIIPQQKQHGHASDQDRQQSSSFSGLSTYASTSGGSLRDLSLSLSARENSQNALFGVRGFLTAAGSSSCSQQTQSSTYLKAAQIALHEECTKAITAGAGGSLVLTKPNAICSSDAARVAAPAAIASNELSFTVSGAVSLSGNSFKMNAQDSDMLRSSQQYHHQQQQQQQQAQQQAAMAHLQLQDHYGRVQAFGHNGGTQLLQPAMMMDRPQQLELKRRKLYIMLEEVPS
ncbi:hypothetical protein L7F22_035085 [Adiantum nelumboides]|nr:hypothetical protein [Adiantum nelumboides]